MPRIFFILLRFRCKTFKTFMNFVWMEVFVSRGEISLYTLLLIFGSLSELKKISFAIKGLYEIDSKFASGVILEYLSILAKLPCVIFSLRYYGPVPRSKHFSLKCFTSFQSTLRWSNMAWQKSSFMKIFLLFGIFGILQYFDLVLTI